MARQRSAERYTAWRRETCGAQPVAGKKPVKDSPTNPAHFLYPSPVTRRWIEGRRHGKACVFAWLPLARSLFSHFQIQRLFKSGEFKKRKEETSASLLRLFSKTETFLLSANQRIRTRRFDIFGFHLSFFESLTQDNDSKLQISSLVYSVVH